MVADAPVVSCESSWAHVGDRNVFVRCKVKARPKVTAIFWILDGNGTTVAEGQVVNEHWTLVMVSQTSFVGVACNPHYTYRSRRHILAKWHPSVGRDFFARLFSPGLRFLRLCFRRCEPNNISTDAPSRGWTKIVFFVPLLVLFLFYFTTICGE